jgi:hypothetical protein
MSSSIHGARTRHSVGHVLAGDQSCHTAPALTKRQLRFGEAVRAARDSRGETLEAVARRLPTTDSARTRIAGEHPLRLLGCHPFRLSWRRTAVDIAARYVREEIPVYVEPDVMSG